MKTKIDLTCPKCNANLSVDAGRETLFCEYCGAKILLNDENTYTIRKVDEAEIRKVEADQLIRLKELELSQRKADNEAMRLKIKLFVSLFLAVIGVVLMTVPSFVPRLYDLDTVGFVSIVAGVLIWVVDARKKH